MRLAWFDFGEQAMALAGPYDLCIRKQANARFRWWVSSSACGFRPLAEGHSPTMDRARSDAEAGFLAHMEASAAIEAARRPTN